MKYLEAEIFISGIHICVIQADQLLYELLKTGKLFR